MIDRHIVLKIVQFVLSTVVNYSARVVQGLIPDTSYCIRQYLTGSGFCINSKLKDVSQVAFTGFWQTFVQRM